MNTERKVKHQLFNNFCRGKTDINRNNARFRHCISEKGFDQFWHNTSDRMLFWMKFIKAMTISGGNHDRLDI